MKKIKDQNVLDRIQAVIERVEEADELSSIADLKKLAVAASFFRIRVGDHRIGIGVEGGTVEFIRCLPRRDLYRFFP